jgi:hypothetical protein
VIYKYILLWFETTFTLTNNKMSVKEFVYAIKLIDLDLECVIYQDKDSVKFVKFLFIDKDFIAHIVDIN